MTLVLGMYVCNDVLTYSEDACDAVQKQFLVPVAYQSVLGMDPTLCAWPVTYTAGWYG